MNLEMMIDYFAQYGLIFIFVIIFLEYLNLPGLAAGIVMPACGVLISKGDISFISAIIISVIAGLLASICLYMLGLYGGCTLLNKYVSKFPSQKPYIDNISEKIRTKGNYGIFISKLIPVARTLVSIPAGTFKINFLSFVVFSTLGIFVWNTAFISAGYLFGNVIFL